MTDRRLITAGSLTIALLIAAACPVPAQTSYTWTAAGGAGSWNTAANWTPSTSFPLVSGDSALFDFLSGAGAVTLSGPVTVGGVTFNNLSATPAQSFTVSGSTISFANQGAGYGITLAGGASTAGTQTISSGLSFLTPTAPFTITNNAAPGANTLTISGAITGTTSLTQLVVAGGSDTTISSGLAAGSFQNLTKTGTGTLTLGGAGSFNGGATLAQGSVVLRNSTALGGSGNVVTLGDATTGGNNLSLLLGTNGTAALTVANNIVVSSQGTGTVTIGTTSFTPSPLAASILSGRHLFNRPVTIQAGSTDRTDFGAASNIYGNVGTLTITGLAATNRVSFSGTSQMQFVGDVNVASGTLQLSQNNVLPFATNVTIAAGATLYNSGTGAATSVSNTIAGLSGGGTLSSNLAPANVLVVGFGGASATFAGKITNNGTNNVGLTKIGTGTQTLSGDDNSTMGPTAVNQGVLNLDFTANNNAKVGTVSGLALGGGTLQITGSAAPFAQLTGNVTVTSGTSTIAVQSGATSLTLAGNAANTFTRNAGGAMDLSNTGTGAISLGTPGAPNTLLSGAITVGHAGWAILDPSKNVVALPAASYQAANDVATWTTATPDATYGLNFTNSAPYTGVLAGPLNASNVRVNAAGASAIDLGGNTLTLGGGGLLVTAAGGPTTVSNGTLVGAAAFAAVDFTSASELTVHNYSAGDVAISATIADNGTGTALNKVGTGRLILSGTNTYTGGTHLNGGLVEVAALTDGGVAGPLGAATNAAANLQFNGGTLRYTGPTATVDRQFTINYGGATVDVADVNANLTFNRGGTVGFGSGGSLPYFTPTGGLTKTGAGTLTLAANGTSPTLTTSHNGLTLVQQGTLEVGGGFTSDQAIRGPITVANGATFRMLQSQIIANASVITVNAGGTFDFGGFSDFVGAVQGAGTITTAAGSVIAVDGVGTSATFSGQLSGPGGFTLRSSPLGVGVGNPHFTQEFAGTRTYTGVTTVQNGTLSIDTLANGGQPSSIGAATSASANIVFAGGTLRYTGGDVTTDRGMSLATPSSFPTPVFDIASANVGITGTITAAANSNVLIKRGSGTLTLGGSATNITTTGTAFIGPNLRVLEGTLVLAKSNTANPTIGTGVPVSAVAGLEVAGGATVRLGGSGDFQLYSGAVAGSNGIYTLFPNATLDLNGNNARVDSLRGAGLVTNSAGGPVSLTVATGNTGGTFAGTISDGAGTTSLVKGGVTATFTFSGAGNFTGPVSVYGGTLGLDYTSNFASKVPANQPITLAGGTLSITGSPATAPTTTNAKGLVLSAGQNGISNATGNTRLDFTNAGGTLSRGLGAGVNFTLGGGGIKLPGTPSANLGGWATATSGTTTTFAGLDADNLVVPVPTATKNDLSTWINGDNIVNSGAFTNSLPVGTTTVQGVTFNFAGVANANLGVGNTLAVTNGILVTPTVAANASTVSGGTLTGPAGGGDLVLNTRNSGTLTVSADIANNGGATNLVKVGAGNLTLSGTNNYTGATILGGGNTTLSTAAALGGSTQVTLNSGNGGDATSIFLAGVTIPSTVALTMIADTPAQSTSDIRASLRSTTGASAWNGPITLSGPGLQSFRVEGGTSLTIGGPVTGGNVLLFLRGAVGTGVIDNTVTLGPASTVVKTDVNTWVINSTGNTWGLTQIGSTGTLRIGADNALPVNAPLLMGGVNASAVGAFDLGGFSQSIPTLNVAGTGTAHVIGNNSTTSPSTLTLAGPGTSLFPGIIRDVNGTGSQTVALTISGGTHTLTGANTYTGATTVGGGTLRVNGSLAAGSAVGINAGGTLGGTGTVNGPLTVNAGGTLDPGASVGTLTVANNVVFTGGTGTTWNVELNGTAPTNADLLNVTGAANTLNFVTTLPSDKITINLVDLVGLPADTSLTYTIASVAPGTGATNVQSNGLPAFDPTQFAFTTPGLSAGGFSIAHVGDAVQVTFTTSPVPEPAFVLATCAAAAGGLGWWRRRRPKESETPRVS